MSLRNVILLVCLCSLPLGTLLWAKDASNELVVHEWGTFTTLQDEKGARLSGINVDDEPVPKFVHNLSRYLLGQPFLTSSHWGLPTKGSSSQASTSHHAARDSCDLFLPA